jgi:hypothetical protein
MAERGREKRVNKSEIERQTFRYSGREKDRRLIIKVR